MIASVIVSNLAARDNALALIDKALDLCEENINQWKQQLGHFAIFCLILLLHVACNSVHKSFQMLQTCMMLFFFFMLRSFPLLCSYIN